jgi:hypothetical protein
MCAGELAAGEPACANMGFFDISGERFRAGSVVSMRGD